MKHFIPKFLLLAAALTLLTGCAQESDDLPRSEDGRLLVTLSDFSPGMEIKEAVTAFNQSNPDYYVEILTGEIGQSVTDYWDREMIELSTGKGPDLFSKTLNFYFNTYIEKGIIEDLMPYIERDLNPEDYLESSLYAYAKDGKVYALESGFAITTLIGSKEILGDRTGWTFDEMKEVMDAHPEITVFENHTMDVGEFLRVYLVQGSSIYTDYENLKKCIAFDKSQEARLPDDVRAVPGENVMVESAVIDDALDLADYEALYNRELVPIGFVNEEHKGIRHESIGWSINAASKQKEGAWAFLRFLLSEEYQREYGRMFSPLKEVFEEQLTAYATPNTYSVFIEALREEVTITQKYSLNRTSNAVSNSNYGDAVGAWEIDCLTEEQLQDIRDLVDRSYVNVFSWDETAYNIITEEVAYYYNGERSLDEVMDYIQNRMDLYMSEKE